MVFLGVCCRLWKEKGREAKHKQRVGGKKKKQLVVLVQWSWR
jgi:hypothetical protein